jgi:hypothetical protein
MTLQFQKWGLTPLVTVSVCQNCTKSTKKKRENEKKIVRDKKSMHELTLEVIVFILLHSNRNCSSFEVLIQCNRIESRVIIPNWVSEILNLRIKTIYLSDFVNSDQTITATLIERLLIGETPYDETV